MAFGNNLKERFSFSKYHKKCFIFAHSHSVAQRASVFLNARGWSNTLLSGKMEQASRTQAWEQLVTKETNILVATGTPGYIIIYNRCLFILFKIWLLEDLILHTQIWLLILK